MSVPPGTSLEPAVLGAATTTERGRAVAIAISGVLLAAFAVTVPYADVPLAVLPGFVPAYDVAVVVLDFVTAILLYAQYRELRERSLLVLACGFTFTPLVIVAHGLSFPDAFGPGYLIGGEQTTAWLWMGWHGLFPAFPAGYALFARRERTHPRPHHDSRAVATLAFTASLLLAGAIILLTTARESLLPPLMLGNQYQSSSTRWILALGWGGHLVAFALTLWATRARRVIDLWILVTLLAALIDLALSALLVTGRYQAGFYVGRGYGLLASTFLLAHLLRQASGLQSSVVRALAALQASGERLRLALDSATMGWFEWRVRDEQVETDERFRALFDVLPAAPLSRAGVIAERIHPDDREALAAAVGRAIEPGGRGELLEEIRVVYQDGSVRWLSVCGRTYFEGAPPRALRMFGVVADVTDRKVAEGVLRRSEERYRGLAVNAEKANREKDEFLAVLSHELRTPLAPILLWGRALQSGRVPRQALDRAIEAIVQSAEIQSRLIEDLLDLSRLSNGKVNLIKQSTSPRDVAESAIQVVRPSASAKGIQLLTEVQADLGNLMLDPDRLQQVLWNILSNAIKFTPTGGKVFLRAQKRGNHLVMEVEDTGQGIPLEFTPRLFERFHQADMGESRVHGGLGIGLALCRHLVELHGGTIAESGGAGQGAIFTVSIPWVDPVPVPVLELAPELGEEAAPRRSLVGKRVLLVEDDHNTREVMRWTLERERAQVIAVASGAEALSALEASAADVIVCDIGLPGMDGYELIQNIARLRRERGLPAIPACAVSAHAREVDRRRAVKAGFELYLPKPVTAEALTEAVRELASG